MNGAALVRTIRELSKALDHASEILTAADGPEVTTNIHDLLWFINESLYATQRLTTQRAEQLRKDPHHG